MTCGVRLGLHHARELCSPIQLKREDQIKAQGKGYLFPLSLVLIILLIEKNVQENRSPEEDINLALY